MASQRGPLGLDPAKSGAVVGCLASIRSTTAQRGLLDLYPAKGGV